MNKQKARKLCFPAFCLGEPTANTTRVRKYHTNYNNKSDDGPNPFDGSLGSFVIEKRHTVQW